MELGGNEKRIQALFSELSLEDQSCVPQFAHVWTRAQVIKSVNAGSLGRRMAVLVSLLVTAAACSLAVWSWSRSTPALPPMVGNRLPLIEAPYPPTPVKLMPGTQREKLNLRHQRNIARQRQVERRPAAEATEAALLSSWQSPTRGFMESPTSVVLSSLPQLSQSAKDLESFLPKNNEIMKESNQ